MRNRASDLRAHGGPESPPPATSGCTRPRTEKQQGDQANSGGSVPRNWRRKMADRIDQLVKEAASPDRQRPGHRAGRDASLLGVGVAILPQPLTATNSQYRAYNGMNRKPTALPGVVRTRPSWSWAHARDRRMLERTVSRIRPDRQATTLTTGMALPMAITTPSGMLRFSTR